MTTAALTGTAPRRATQAGKLLTLGLLAVTGACLAYLLLDSGGDLGFTLAFRGRKLLGLILVGWSVGMATVGFQTVTGTRILTPSVMGLDSMFAFIQTLLLFLFGTTISSQLGPVALFVINLVAMVGLGWGLSGLLLRRHTAVHLLVLIGIVLGTLLRSLQQLLTRIMDPTAFLQLQTHLFASFNSIRPELLTVSAVLVTLGTVWVWRLRHRLDVMALGHATAQGLGVDPRQMVRQVLLVSVLLVSVTTALVGPITFLGLIVANLAYQLSPSGRHAWTMPLASALAVVLLVAGQAVLEYVFAMGTVLSVIIEFGGGLPFIVMVVSRSKPKGTLA